MPTKRHRAPEGPFAVFHQHLKPGNAPKSRGKLRDTLSVWPLLTDGAVESYQGQPAHAIQDDDPFEQAASAFLQRCKQFASEEHVQAALLAADALARHSVTLPPIKFDRSKWNSKIAASLPLRAIKAQTAEEAAAAEDDGDLLQSMYPTASTQRPGKGQANVVPKAERLTHLLGTALDKFLSVAAMKEAEERAAAQQLLRLAAEEEARAGLLGLRPSDQQVAGKAPSPGSQSAAAGSQLGKSEKATISAAIVAALATQKLMGGRTFAQVDIRALSRRPSGDLSGASRGGTKSVVVSPRASQFGGPRGRVSHAGGLSARSRRTSVAGGAGGGGWGAISSSIHSKSGASRPVSAKSKKDMFSHDAMDHLAQRLQSALSHRPSVSFNAAASEVGMLKPAMSSLRGSRSARTSASGGGGLLHDGDELRGAQDSLTSPRGAPPNPRVPRMRASLTGSGDSNPMAMSGQPSPSARVSRFAPTHLSAGGAAPNTRSLAHNINDNQASFKARHSDRRSRMSLPGHQLEYRASFAPTLEVHRSIRVSHDGFENLDGLPQGESLGTVSLGFDDHDDDDMEEMPGKELIWDNPKPNVGRLGDFRRGYASHAGHAGAVDMRQAPHLSAHMQAGPRASLTGAMLATNAALGTAPKIKASGAAAAALAVFNAAAGTPVVPSPSRFSMPAPLRVHLDSSSSDSASDSSGTDDEEEAEGGKDKEGDGLPGRASPTKSAAGEQQQSQQSPSRLSQYSKTVPTPTGALKTASQAGSERHDSAASPKVQMNHPMSRLASVKHTASRRGSEMGGVSSSLGGSPRHSGSGVAPTQTPSKPKPYDPWASATGAVQLDDEDDDARAKRITRLMGRGGHLLKPRTKAPAFGAGRPSTAGGTSIKRPVSTVPSIFDVTKAQSNQASTPGAATVQPVVVVKEPSRSGVCLSFIQTLAGLVTTEVGQAAACKLTTSEVIQRFIAPRTPRGSRFLDTLPESVIGTPRYMISHRRAGSFLALVQELTKYLQDQAGLDPDRVFLWLDFMAIDQSSQYEADALLAVVGDVIRIAHQTLVVIDPEGTALNRTWILYEMWATTRATMPNKLIILTEGGLRATALFSELYAGIDVMRSEASDEGEREALLLDMRSAIASTPANGPALAARTGGAAATAITAKARELADKNKGGAAQTPGGRRAVRRDVSFSADKADQQQSQGGGSGGVNKKRSRRRPTSMALLQADMTIINRALKAAILDSCVREAKRAMKALGTPKAVPTAYIRHATLAAVMYHLNGEAADAEVLLRRLMAYQLSGPHGTVRDLANVVLALVDVLMVQHKRQDALTVAGKAHEAAERMLGPNHKVTVQMALTLWQVLSATAQHEAAEALARSIHTRLLRLFDTKRTAVQNTYLSPFGDSSQHYSIESSAHSSFHAAAVGGSPGGGSEGNSMTRRVLDALSDGGSSDGSGDGNMAMMSEEEAVKKVELELELACAFLALGKSLMALDQKTEASSVLEEGMDRWQALLGGEHHPRCIEPLLTLGRCEASMQMHGDAIPSFTQARAMLARWYARESATWVEACCDQAASLQAMGDLRTAEKLMRRLLAPPLRTRLSSRGGAPDDKANPPPDPAEVELAAEKAEDTRLGGLSFKVKSRLVEALVAKSVTVPFSPTEVEIVTSAGFTPTVHSPKAGGGPGEHNVFLHDLNLGGHEDEAVAATGTTPKAKDPETKRLTEAEKIVGEAVDLTVKLLERFGRSRAALLSSKPVEAENQPPDTLTAVGAIPLSDKLAMSKAKPRLPALNSSPAGKVPPAKSGLPALPVLGKPDTKQQVNKPAKLSPEVEQALREVEERRHASWRAELMSIVRHMHEHGETLRDGGELEAAYSAMSTAMQAASELVGVSDPATVEIIALTVDILMRLRRFKQAFNVMNTHRNHPSMSSGAMELLRIQLEPLMTAHAFEAADTNDPELVLWALELGSSTMNGVERLLVVAAGNGFLPVTMAVTTVSPSSVAEEEGEQGMRALAVAAALGHAHIVQHLLKQKHVMVDALDWEGRTALWHASATGQYDCTRMLLEQGRANPNLADMHRITPLMAAASQGYLEIMQILLEKRAKPDATDASLRTALMTAAAHAQPASLELLLRCHAKANLKDSAGTTALMLACAEGSYECVYVLLSNKCDVDTQDDAGQTAFFKAAALGFPQLVGMLLVEGADLYVRDQEGRTMLHAAAQAGRVGVVALIIRYLAKGIESIPGHNKRLGATDANVTWMSDAHSMGVQAHVKMKVDEVLTSRGLVVANQVTGTIDDSVDVIDDTMKTLLINAAAKGTSTVTTAAQSMAGGALSSPTRKSGVSQAQSAALSRAGGASQSGEQVEGEGELTSPEATQEDKDLDDLKSLLAYTHVAQVRQFVSVNDKYGLTAADLAKQSGHMVLSRILVHFMKKAVMQMESDQDASLLDVDDDTASATGKTPLGTSSGLPGAVLPERTASQFEQQRTRRESFSGANVRRRLLAMAAEYDE